MMKKNIIRTSATALVFCLLATAFPVTNVDAKAKPKLNKKKITVLVGSTKKLKIKNVRGKKVTWKTSNKKVATVKKAGKYAAVIKGKKSGKAIITAKIGKKKIKCRVNVKDGKIYQHKSIEYYESKRTQIYNELGITSAMKPQYICFLLAKWECDHVEYSEEDAKKTLGSTSWVDDKSDDHGQTFQQALDMGTAVCGGYTDLYEFLLDGIGIPNKTLMLRKENHAYNHVKIDGQWYGVDVTCMDEGDDIADVGEGGRYDMASFLMPDSMMPVSYKNYGATSMRFVKTIYEELTVYSEKHPDIVLIALDYYDSNGNFIGKLGDFSGQDYTCNPWFTGTWINY